MNELQIAEQEVRLFELKQREAKALASSSLIPERLTKGKTQQEALANMIIVMDLQKRMGLPIMCIAQNLFVVYGVPCWSSTFIISAINSCGRYSSLKYHFEGDGMDRTCYAWTTEKLTGEVLKSSVVSMKMAKSEGWLGKKGSKWQTMPDQMMMYRAAAFFGRAYAPELFNGMMSKEEAYDIEANKRHIKDVSSCSVDSILSEQNNDEPKAIEDIKQEEVIEQLSDVVIEEENEPVYNKPFTKEDSLALDAQLVEEGI